MAAHVQDIIYGVTGQSLIFDPPEGRPTSVTSCTVYPIETGDDGTAEVATTGSASIDSVNTTFDGNAGIGQSDLRRCPLTATTNIAIGRVYLATNAQGEKEWVTVTGIQSGQFVYVSEPLRNAYVSTDTFVGARVSISIDSTWVADSSNITDDTDPNPGYRVRWVYVVGGVTYVHDAYFDLVRYVGAHSVLPTDMLTVVPDWYDRLPTYHQEDQGRRLLDKAYEDVRYDLHRAGHADEMIRHSPAVDRLTQLKAWVLLERSGANDARLAMAMEAYSAEIDGLVRVVTKIPEATGPGGGGVDTTAHALWGR